MTEVKAPSMLRTGLVLGLLSTLGPLSIDLYLPAFPTMARDLGGSAADVQRSLSIFLLALAAAQIPWGSLGDRFGRKRPLYLGLALFVLGSAGCAAARDPQMLIAMRFVQGFGICAGTAVSRAMIRDLYSGHQAARMLALSFLVIGLSPVLAPLLGSFFLQAAGWRAMFWLLGTLGLAAMLLAAMMLPESLPREKRLSIHPRALLSAYAALLGNGRYMAAAMVAGLATTTPYASVTAAPFLFAQGYGLSPTAYGVLLGVAAFCSIGATQFSPNLMRALGPERHLALTTGGGIAVAALLVALALGGAAPLAAVQGLLMLLFVLVGLTLTPAAVTALDAAPAAGAGAAMLGTVQLVVTALASAAISLFPAGALLPLALLLFVTWLLAALCARRAFA